MVPSLPLVLVVHHQVPYVPCLLWGLWGLLDCPVDRWVQYDQGLLFHPLLHILLAHPLLLPHGVPLALGTLLAL